MKLSVIANPDKFGVTRALQDMLTWTGRNEIPVYLNHTLCGIAQESRDATPDGGLVQTCESEQQAIGNSDIVVAIGGDGTMLRTARLVAGSGKPVIGVNTGRMGFLANIHKDRLQDALEFLKSGNYKLDRRLLLSASLQGNETTFFAMNEFLFAKGSQVPMITISVEYDGEFVNRYWADGIIVSTPTGSTAYNLSSGGPIAMPHTDVVIITPICPHTLTTRPLVLPAGKNLRVYIEPQDQQVLFSADGEDCLTDGTLPAIDINRSSLTVDLIQTPGQSYFETLRNKLMWGVDRRDVY